MNENGNSRKELIGQVFDRAASGYRELPYLEPLGRRLAELADIPCGARVLDAASGRGAALFPAAERAGKFGCVIGIDLAEQMVNETLAEAQERGVTNVQLCQMDAEELRFEDASFDIVLCGFALFFFPHPERALSEFHRVLKQGGRLAVSTWGAPDARWRWYDQALAHYGASVKLRTRMLDERRELASFLKESGFDQVRVITEYADWRAANEEEWWKAQWAVSGRLGLEQLEPERLERLRAETFRRMQALRKPDGFHTALEAHLAVGRKSV